MSPVLIEVLDQAPDTEAYGPPGVSRLSTVSLSHSARGDKESGLSPDFGNNVPEVREADWVNLQPAESLNQI